MLKRVYFDIDGVFTNLTSFIEKYYGVTFKDGLVDFLVSETNMEPSDIFHKMLLKELKENKIFETLPRHHYFDEMLELMKDCVHEGYKVGFLTSLGELSIVTENGHDGGEELVNQKLKWLKANFPQSLLDKVTLNVSFSCKEKANFARPDTLLIDDRSVNCDDFERAGGHAFHYGHDRHSKCILALRTLLFHD
tara:strand:+ start:588 stop:1166 length:579 start_codon:yes stop_codon:yes gene_type:complete